MLLSVQARKEAFMARGTDANAGKFSYNSIHTLEHKIWLEIGFTSLEAKVLKDNLCSDVLTIVTV